MVTATGTRTDEQIKRDVLAELKWDARLLANEIGVIVKDGVVTLTGWVDSYIKKLSAEEAAHHVSGVKAVANDIEVKLATERTDADVAEAALRALKWDALVPHDKLTVTVSNGWITLEGEVEWQYQKEDAMRAVRRLSGVTGVTNLITVKPRVSPTDLKRQIADALVRSAEIDAGKISVEVRGTTAILRGTVRCFMEKQTAERAAWSAPGIAAVEDLITVEI